MLCIHILPRSHQNITGWVTPLGHRDGEQNSAHWTGSSWGGGREGGVNLGGEELASLSSMGGEETLALPQCLRREVWKVAAYPEHVQCYC